MELEYIRSCVSTALADVHYRQRGILEVQLEQMRLGRSGRFNNKPVRSISVGDDNSYEVSVPAEPVRFHQGKHLNNHQCCSLILIFRAPAGAGLLVS